MSMIRNATGKAILALIEQSPSVLYKGVIIDIYARNRIYKHMSEILGGTDVAVRISYDATSKHFLIPVWVKDGYVHWPVQVTTPNEVEVGDEAGYAPTLGQAMNKHIMSNGFSVLSSSNQDSPLGQSLPLQTGAHPAQPLRFGTFVDEKEFCVTFLAPLVQQMGYQPQLEHACRFRTGRDTYHGKVDLMVLDQHVPITVIEAKHTIHHLRRIHETLLHVYRPNEHPTLAEVQRQQGRRADGRSQSR